MILLLSDDDTAFGHEEPLPVLFVIISDDRVGRYVDVLVDNGLLIL